jgi:hypothetical protein
MVLHHDRIDQVFGGVGKDQAGDPVDHHQQKAQSQQVSAGTDEFPQNGPNGSQSLTCRAGVTGRFARRRHLLVRVRPR